MFFTSFRYKNLYLILLGYFIDLQSTFIKKDFINKVSNLIKNNKNGWKYFR